MLRPIMLFLAINSGSSSLKCAAIDPDTGEALFSALAERIGTEQARWKPSSAGDESKWRELGMCDHVQALSAVLDELKAKPDLWQRLEGVGHRVVHGGEHFSSSQLISEEVLAGIEECARLAPLHNPANLLGIRAAMTALPDLPQVAVFDTAFHQTMPEAAYRYAVPESWYQDHGVRRYGFHGTSHRFVSAQAAQLLGRAPQDLNLITAHLGNGCSAAAIAGGKSVDTSMGFTPLEGLVMGTRSGDLDPAILCHLQKHGGLDAEQINHLLNHESGLLGLSGVSNDMRQLREIASENKRAALAIDVFCHRLAKYIGALATSFERLDGIVFTGGIGEHAALVRQKVCERLSVLGAKVNDAANQAHEFRFDAAESSLALMVIPTNEELLIAQDTRELTQRK